MRDERVRGVMEFEAARAREFFAKAREALTPTDRRALLAAEIMAAIYERLLDKMQRDGFQVFDRRYALSKWEKFVVILRAIRRNRFQ